MLAAVPTLCQHWINVSCSPWTVAAWAAKHVIPANTKHLYTIYTTLAQRRRRRRRWANIVYMLYKCFVFAEILLYETHTMLSRTLFVWWYCWIFVWIYLGDIIWVPYFNPSYCYITQAGVWRGIRDTAYVTRKRSSAGEALRAKMM